MSDQPDAHRTPLSDAPSADPAPAAPRSEYRKVGVIGAGAVGTSVCATALMSGVADEVALYDVNEVIQGKGATNHAIGVATNRLLEAVFKDERAVLQVLETDLDAGEVRQLQTSARALREAARSLGF